MSHGPFIRHKWVRYAARDAKDAWEWRCHECGYAVATSRRCSAPAGSHLRKSGIDPNCLTQRLKSVQEVLES